jgi:cytochrome P450
MSHVTPEPRSLRDLPGPAGLPLLGNALQVDSARFHQNLEGWQRQFGDLFRVRLARREFMVVATPELIQQVLRDRPDGFRRIDTLEPIAKELGLHGLFSAEGDSWKRQRQLWMASLNTHQLRPFHDQLQTITRRLLRRWEQAADQGTPVDVASDLMRFTVDVTLHFALGTTSNTLEGGEDVIQQHLDQIFPELGHRLTAPFPYWRYLKLPRQRRLDRALATLRTHVAGLIKQAEQRLAQAGPGAEPTCFLDALLLAQRDAEPALSDAAVHGNVMTVMLAGEDTTANTGAWLMHECSRHPDLYARLRAEADAWFAAHPDDSRVPHAGHFAHELPVCDAAITETLRLYPVAPLFMVQALRDTVLGDVEVPTGTRLVVLLRPAAGSASGQDPAPRFTPELDPDDTAHQAPGQAATLPFGFGKRMCPGRHLAISELRSLVLMLARNFDLEPVPGPHPVRERFSFTMVPEHLRIRLRRRSAA